MDNFHNILHYLKLENINIDSKEFLFQVKSHPNFPSLLAVTDTLSFFNIENGVFDIQFDEIESLPNNFLVILKENRNDTHLYLVESKNGKFFIMRDGKSEFISKDKLKAKWNNFVLFVEKTDSNIVFKKNSNTLIWFSAFVFMLFFLMFFFFEKISFLSTLFLILPIFGMMFSIGAFKDILGSNNGVINAFCNISTSTSCTEIISSNKWKIFDVIKLSDLSMVFFCYQIVGYMNALFGTIGEFMYIQRILLLVVIPIIPISLYYQKKVEKKWCPICLGIIAIVILEIININTLFQIQNASIKTILISGFIFSGMSVLWLFIKTVFLKMKELKEFQYEGTRFMRNFEIFKTVLKAENSVRLPQSFIVLGQKNSNKILTIITNPFCSPL